MFRNSGHCFDKFFQKGVFTVKKTLAVILAFIMIAGCMTSLAFAEEIPTATKFNGAIPVISAKTLTLI